MEDGVIARRREKVKNEVYRARLSGVRAVVDSHEPATVGIRHLQERRRKKQKEDEAQYRIAKENRMLMENMARILAASQPTPAMRAQKSVNDAARRRGDLERKAKNRMLAKRLRRITPHYDRAAMADDHERRQRYLRNISKAKQRFLSFQAVGGGGGPRGASGSSTAEPAMVIDQDKMATPSLHLRTAKQVRRDVALERGYDLPPLFNSDNSLFNDYCFYSKPS